MELHQVRYFVTLCETLNFTKAAELCNVTQPSLTKAIHKLEDELGGPLFCRERGLTHLTSLGRAMQPHLQAIHTSNEAAKAEAKSYKNLQSANLLIGIQETLGPSPLVAFFKTLHEQMPNAALTLRTDNAQTLLDQLLDGSIDTAVLAQQDLPERCDAFDLYAEPYVVAVPSQHLLTQKDAITVQELENEAVYTCPNDPVLAALGFQQPKVHHDSAAKNWTQACIAADLGCAILPAYAARIYGTETRPFHHPDLQRQIILVTIAGRRHAPALSQLLNLARHHEWPTECQ